MIKYITGSIIFIMISIISIGGLLIYDNISLKELFKQINRLEWRYVFFILGTVIGYLVIESLKLKVLCLGLRKNPVIKVTMKAILGNQLLSAITPFQSGGQPFEVFILARNSIPFSHALVFAYMRTWSSLVCLFLISLSTLLSYSELGSVEYLYLLYLYSIGFMIYFSILSYFLIIKPGELKKLMKHILKFLVKIRILKRKKLRSRIKFTVKEVDLFHGGMKEYLKNPLWTVLGIILSFFSLGIKYLGAYFIALGLKMDIKIMQILLYQYLIDFINFSIPVPGASGTSEITAYTLFKLILGEETMELGLFVNLWRFFSHHLIVVIATLSTIGLFKKNFKKSMT